MLNGERRLLIVRDIALSWFFSPRGTIASNFREQRLHNSVPSAPETAPWRADFISSREESCRLFLCVSSARSGHKPERSSLACSCEPKRRRSQTACQLEHIPDPSKRRRLAGKPGCTEPREDCARAAYGVVNRPGPQSACATYRRHLTVRRNGSSA